MRTVKTYDDFFEIIDDGVLVERRPLTNELYSTIELHLASLQPLADKVIAGNVPSEVTMKQARLALFQNNLLTMVNSAILSIPSPQGDAIRIDWEYSITVRRDSALVNSLTSSLGITPDALDNLFIFAATL